MPRAESNQCKIGFEDRRGGSGLSQQYFQAFKSQDDTFVEPHGMKDFPTLDVTSDLHVTSIQTC